MIKFMEEGSKTVFILNTLILADISTWKNKYMIMLIDMFRNFTEADFEDNRLLLSYNPLLCIALSAELLTKISNSRPKFKNVCNGLKHSLLSLGKMYNSKITDEDYFVRLMMDTDFSNRSALKIITDCQLDQLMSEEDTKSENIMKTLMEGKEANMCDGDVYGYSNFLAILFSAPKADEE